MFIPKPIFFTNKGLVIITEPTLISVQPKVLIKYLRSSTLFQEQPETGISLFHFFINCQFFSLANLPLTPHLIPHYDKNTLYHTTPWPLKHK